MGIINCLYYTHIDFICSLLSSRLCFKQLKQKPPMVFFRKCLIAGIIREIVLGTDDGKEWEASWLDPKVGYSVWGSGDNMKDAINSLKDNIQRLEENITTIIDLP